MLKLIGKKIFTILCSKILFILACGKKSHTKLGSNTVTSLEDFLPALIAVGTPEILEPKAIWKASLVAAADDFLPLVFKSES